MTGARLPDFPWDSLAPYKERASPFRPLAGPGGGLVDLSVGTPVDPTPDVVQGGTARGRRRAGLPADLGHPRAARGRGDVVRPRRGVPDLDPDGVLPTVGSRSSSPGCRPSWAWAPVTSSASPRGLPDLRRRRPPRRGAPPVVDGLAALGPLTAATTPKLLWLNSPGNPTGQVLGVEHLAKVVAWARQHGVVVASDECYAELDWRPEPRLARAADDPLDPRPARHAAAPTRGCSASTRCPSSPTSPATGPRSSQATRRSSAGCSRSASTPG